METDEFFERLGKQWQQAPAQALPEFSPEDARRAQRNQRRVSGVHWVLGAVGLLAALYFLTLPRTAVTLAAALTLTASVVVDFWFIRTQRRSLQPWADWSPEGLLAYRRNLLRAKLRAARYYVWSAIGLLVFTAFLWGYAWLTPDFAAGGFHRLFSVFSIPVSGSFLVYFGSALRRTRDRLRHVQALLADYAAE